jgi:hypothetical protein
MIWCKALGPVFPTQLEHRVKLCYEPLRKTLHQLLLMILVIHLTVYSEVAE